MNLSSAFLLFALLCFTFMACSDNAIVQTEPPIDNDLPSKIAFVGSADGQENIYVINPDGTELNQLTEGGRNSDPAWSPDGESIIFSSLRFNGLKGIIMDSDGNNEVEFGTSTSIIPNTWSPDGQKILFSNAADIFSVRPDGTELVNLTERLNAQSIEPPAYMDFDWSPDGSKIVYSVIPGSDQRVKIGIMNADGTNKKDIYVNAAENARFPTWSPDGTKIAFTLGSTVSGAIYIMNADGSDAAGVSNISGVASAPYWSPDGEKIAFLTGLFAGTRLAVLTLEDSREITFDHTFLPSQFLNPWSPDGKMILGLCATGGFSKGLCSINIETEATFLIVASNFFISKSVWSPFIK